MKPVVSLITLFTVLGISTISLALPVIDIEAAIGGWMQIPSGNVAYPSDAEPVNADDLNYDTETKIYGRALVDLPVLPTLYIMAAPMTFEGEGQGDFSWAGDPIDADVPFSSKLTLNQTDVTLYYSLPLLNLATLGALNIDLGLDARHMDVEFYIEQEQIALQGSQDFTVWVPMIYVAAQLSPTDNWSLEAEFRGISYSDATAYSLIARLKAKIFGPAFAAGGYRYDAIDIDEQDIRLDVSIGGPFIEAGIQF